MPVEDTSAGEGVDEQQVCGAIVAHPREEVHRHVDRQDGEPDGPPERHVEHAQDDG